MVCADKDETRFEEARNKRDGARYRSNPFREKDAIGIEGIREIRVVVDV